MAKRPGGRRSSLGTNLDDPPAEEEPAQDSDPAPKDTDPEVACDGADGVRDTADAEDGEHGDTSTHPIACAFQYLLGKATGEPRAMLRAYEKLQLPALPEAGDTDSWLSAVKWACARAGEAFSDCLELAWVTERTSATLEQLSLTSWARQSMSSLYNGFPERWRKLDLILARTLGCMLENSQEPRAKVSMTAVHEYAKLCLVVRGRRMVWLILGHSKSSHDSHKPWRQERRLGRPHGKPVTSTCRPPAAFARLGGMDERRRQANTDCSPSSRASDEPGGRECTPMDVGVCWDFARLGKCRTGGCTLQHLTADGLMEAIGRDTEVELMSPAGSHLPAGSGHNHSSRARVGEHWHGGGSDRTAQQEAARHGQHRPKWCRGCKLDSCPRPLCSATALVETGKGGVASTSCVGLRDNGSAAMQCQRQYQRHRISQRPSRRLGVAGSRVARVIE